MYSVGAVIYFAVTFCFPPLQWQQLVDAFFFLPLFVPHDAVQLTAISAPFTEPWDDGSECAELKCHRVTLWSPAQSH